MTFAETLKQWRAKQGVTQREAAEYLCVEKRSYEAWEVGRREPDQTGPILKIIAMKEKVPRTDP